MHIVTWHLSRGRRGMPADREGRPVGQTGVEGGGVEEGEARPHRQHVVVQLPVHRLAQGGGGGDLGPQQPIHHPPGANHGGGGAGSGGRSREPYKHTPTHRMSCRSVGTLAADPLQTFPRGLWGPGGPPSTPPPPLPCHHHHPAGDTDGGKEWRW